jgi:hypothetical protein
MNHDNLVVKEQNIENQNLKKKQKQNGIKENSLLSIKYVHKIDFVFIYF